MRIALLSLLLLAASPLAFGQAPSGPLPDTAPPEGAAVDCSRWTVRATSVGMTIVEVDKLGRKLKAQHGPKDLLPQGPAAVWWSWVEDRWHGRVHWFATDAENVTAKIVTMVYVLPEDGTDPEKLIAALTEKWGPPTAQRESDSRRLVTGAAASPDASQTDQLVTRWDDASCDVSVRFIERQMVRKGVPTVGTALLGISHAVTATEMYIRVDRLTALGAQANKAVDALK